MSTPVAISGYQSKHTIAAKATATCEEVVRLLLLIVVRACEHIRLILSGESLVQLLELPLP